MQFLPKTRFTALSTSVSFLLLASLGASAEVLLNVGDNFQSKVNTNPAGTVYRVASGVHRLQSVTPKSGDTFIGENGAVMKGSKTLDPAAAVSSGSLYYWTGQTQQAHSPYAYGENAKPGSEQEVYYANELFVNGVRYRHVNSLAAVVAPNEWFFDYAADRVYMYGSPAGKTIETSVTTTAFNLGGLSDVTLENLAILQYANSIRPSAAIATSNSSRIILRYLDVSYNHATGSNIGPETLAENCRFHDNGQMGIGGGGGSGNAPVYVRRNEIAYNNPIGYDAGEEGSLKITTSFGGLFEQNWVHDNIGYGIWFDVYNEANVIRSNLVECLNSPRKMGRGIFYEISGNAANRPTRIYWNTIRNVGDSGVDISNSTNAYVFENALTEAGGAALHGRDNARSPGFSKYRAWGNDVLMATGVQHMVSGPSASVIELIESNTYRGANRFSYFGTEVQFPTWQGDGYDTSGSYTAGTSMQPHLPTWATPFQPSLYGTLPSTRELHLRFDESSGTTVPDSSGKGRNGTVSGNPSWLPTGGVIRGALGFEQDDGTQDYVDLGTAAGSSAALTVAFWMKPDQTDRYGIPIGKSAADASGSGWSIKLRPNGDVWFRVGSESNRTDVAVAPGTYSTNWMHVAATFFAGTAKVYINGVLKATRSGITQQVSNSSTPLRLGKNAAGVIEPFDGMLDDVQIYSEALSDNQIAALPASLGLAPRLRFECGEPYDSSVLDSSGNDNLGTINGGVSWVTARTGYGLNYDGATGSVSVPHAAALDLTGSTLTLMGWVRPDAITGYRAVVSTGSSCYELNVRDGHPRVEIGLSDGTVMRAETTNVEVTVGQYYHVAAVRSGDVVTLYVNGVSKPVTYIDARKTTSNRLSTNALCVGRRPGASLWFAGVLDEIEVYNEALSAGEVLLRMN